jgi:glycosyltransferase involved in cell wall biosynthesis
MPKVSIIIPCYNQGQFLDEAVNSVVNQTFTDYEIIVINDGSTDELSIEVLKSYKKHKTKVYHTDNQGLAAARNYGISLATGEYILPLDADDKIGSTYLEKAIPILDANPEIGIVYCKARLFGIKNRRCDLPPFDADRILLQNLIFCTAFFRRSDWAKCNGYNPNMKGGWEDWDFWLSLLELNKKVYQLPEFLFYYRLKKDSMATAIKYQKSKELHAQLFHNHKELFSKNIAVIFDGYYNLVEKNNSLPRKILESILAPSMVFSLIRRICS